VLGVEASIAARGRSGVISGGCNGWRSLPFVFGAVASIESGGCWRLGLLAPNEGYYARRLRSEGASASRHTMPLNARLSSTIQHIDSSARAAMPAWFTESTDSHTVGNDPASVERAQLGKPPLTCAPHGRFQSCQARIRHRGTHLPNAPTVPTFLTLHRLFHPTRTRSYPSIHLHDASDVDWDNMSYNYPMLEEF